MGIGTELIESRSKCLVEFPPSRVQSAILLISSSRGDLELEITNSNTIADRSRINLTPELPHKKKAIDIDPTKKLTPTPNRLPNVNVKQGNLYHGIYELRGRMSPAAAVACELWLFIPRKKRSVKS